MNTTFAIAVSAVLALGSALTAQSGDAVYEVTHISTWSAKTHPTDFPSFPHYSPLVGATHNDKVSLWKSGGLATSGIESMAETGSTRALLSEVNAAIKAGTAKAAVTGGGLSKSPGSLKVRFTVSASHPRLTLVSMLAPSPDWFIGVSGLSLMKNGRWIDNMTVPLHLYDAGTDSGASYTSGNSDTNPQEKIARITTTSGPFKGRSTIVGSYVIRRVSSTVVYGCKVNPAGSLTVNGAAVLGSTLSVSVHDPLFSMPRGSATAIFVAAAPTRNFPCGAKIPSLGLGKPGSVGELLVSQILFRVNGMAWQGRPIAFPFKVPNNKSVLGVTVYGQGAMAARGGRVAITDAVEVKPGM